LEQEELTLVLQVLMEEMEILQYFQQLHQQEEVGDFLLEVVAMEVQEVQEVEPEQVMEVQQEVE
jgi:hypothetical protein